MAVLNLDVAESGGLMDLIKCTCIAVPAFANGRDFIHVYRNFAAVRESNFALGIVNFQ